MDSILVPILIAIALGAAVYFAVSKRQPPRIDSANKESAPNRITSEFGNPSILFELRAIREETVKVKWAVRGVGFLIALIILFGFTITQK